MTTNMTPVARAALEESIKDWKKRKISGGATQCPLCKLFNKAVTCVEDKCSGCPIRAYTGRPSCYGTPYTAVQALVYASRPTDTDEALQLAIADEIAFLEGVLRGDTAPPAHTKQVTKWVSERGKELFGSPCDIPLLTVENYCKWYNLYVILPNGRVEHLEAAKERREAVEWVTGRIHAKYGESAISDHTYNPRFYVWVAEHLGYAWDSEALEIIIGRWELESKDTVNYRDIFNDNDEEKAKQHEQTKTDA